MASKSAHAVVPLIIAVDGRSGAGKTTLAVELAALLRQHHTVSLFHLEDIYPGWDGLAGGMERYVRSVLTPLAAGSPAAWTAWDWTADDDGETRTTLPADIVVVEGVGAACAAARELVDVVVWIEADENLRRTSALERDGDTYAPFWQRWSDQEERWLASDNPAEDADLLVQGHRGSSVPEQLRLALTGLPQCESLMSMERAARRGLTLQVETLERYPDAAGVFQGLYGGSASAAWLDSSAAEDPQGRSRFSILADDGGRFGQLAQHTAGITEVQAGAVTARIAGPFFRWLDGVWGRRAVRRPASYPGPFALGWLGYLGYELKRETGGRTEAAGSIPDASLLFAGRAVVLDRVEGRTHLLTLRDGSSDNDADEWLERARAVVLSPAASPRPARPLPAPRFAVRDSREEYLDKIRDAKAEITDGNSYEVCLTTALTARHEQLDPFAVHLILRGANPAPFASYFAFPGLALASTSPERFLQLDADGGMRAEPIKGTRRRSPDPDEDAALKADLAGSTKDRAENIMIVDLLRNDLSHLALPGSVTVSRLCDIETYATVHQMVSTIDARLRPGSSRAEAVAAAFPAGSMTGAPKISTMAILDRLEGAPRGIYSGAAGYFSLDGAADLAVVIRSLVMEADDGGTRLTLGVGGAITADSDPADEWEEVRTKAFGVLSALGTSFPDEE
ncbi:aminodeoxychorismate synthase component I [Arthrobacter sp. JZ12]|uniref:chorismate-binding protein n=1 Tax=Arthrobacter sp. JZ12 TaxID=2654190 RepID=UPI002B4A778F|nr:chorismate-binding protein [Arthrobacter sp. JZ12]WRH25875.1 aminodeoxychorismate synthase component I [Arthrobacter sp. JZ12]